MKILKTIKYCDFKRRKCVFCAISVEKTNQNRSNCENIEIGEQK